uniref:VPS9 domain-containing protein n=1 Tax=Knipowitschia caucasica TaxID=637954 RepID=A0AAV2J215_KNICA
MVVDEGGGGGGVVEELVEEVGLVLRKRGRRAVHGAVSGTTAIPWRSSRSSSRRSSRRRLLQRLKDWEEAWSPPPPWDREEAQSALRGTQPGSFLVLRDHVTCRPRLLCVATDGHVTEREILFSDRVCQLSGSRLSFPDVFQLLLFCSFSRDVLPEVLRLPPWIFSESPESSELGPKMWLSASSENPPEEKSEALGSVLCCLQMTSSNGALCVVNPLYLHEHGDEWLMQRPLAQRPLAQMPPAQRSLVQRPLAQSSRTSDLRRDQRRLSGTRPWSGAGLIPKRAVSLDQEPAPDLGDSSGVVRARSADSSKTPVSSGPASSTSGVVLRRPSRDSPIATSSPITTSSPSAPSPLAPVSHMSPSPHRVSWIQDGVWLPPPSPPSLLHLPSMELDSLSVSSVEEDPDPLSGLASSSHRLADKVRHRFSAVGQALGGLVCPKRRFRYRVQEMSDRRGSVFADGVRTFVDGFLQKSPERDGLTEFLQEVRASLTALRETLLEHVEIQGLLDAMTDMTDAEIDILVERSIHKVALKPVASHLYGCIQTSRSSDGILDRLQRNQRPLQAGGVGQLGGSEGVGVPDQVTLERIRERWDTMHEAYSPNKKVEVLLKVCKNIYHCMSAGTESTGAVLGADDFLPCLSWVLLQSDVVALQVDTEYMMELLDPTQLQGEGGYYLTSLYAALFFISSFRTRRAVRQLSVEAQQSLSQWHRRRTLHCDHPPRRKLPHTIHSRGGEGGEEVPQRGRGRGGEEVPQPGRGRGGEGSEEGEGGPRDSELRLKKWKDV